MMHEMEKVHGTMPGWSFFFFGQKAEGYLNAAVGVVALWSSVVILS